jgi:amino acid adenylation domain-containing protein
LTPRDGSAALEAAIRRTLGECCPGIDFTASRGLVEQGMTSLAATRFVFQVEDTFGVQIDIDGLARGMSLRDVLAQAGGHGAASPVAARADEEIALTPLQQAYLMTSDPAVTGDPVGCHIYREIEFDGADGHAVAGAWHRLTAHHEMLRARVTPAGTLSIGPDQALDVIEVPRARHAETVRARRGVWETRTHRSPAALLLAALVVSDGLVTAILSVDGLLMDGHALALILDQWGRLALDPATPLPRAALSVPDCVRSLAVPVASAGQAHWRRALAGAPLGPFSGTVTAHLAFREALEGAPPIPRRSLCARLGASEWRLCKAKAAAIGVSASAMVFAAFAEVVLELAGEPRATFILTTSDRGRLPLEARLLVGCFASSMVVPVALAGDERFDELAARVHRALWGHLKHGAVGAAAALQAAGLAGRKPGSFPVVFTSLLGQEQDGPPAVVRVSHAGSQTSGIALDHQVWEDDGALIMRSDVADEMLPPMTADLCLGRVVARLRAAAAETREGPPLNALQQAYLVSRAVRGEASRDCCATFSVRFANVGLPAIVHAWESVVARHEALRQVVHGDGTVEILDATLRPEVGWTTLPAACEDRRAALDLVLQGLPRPLGRWPLHDVHVLADPGGSSLHMAFDLVALDGRSIHQVVEEVTRRLVGPEAAVAAPTCLGAPDAPPAAGDAGYWTDRIGRMPPGPCLPRREGASGAWHRKERRIAGFDGVVASCRAGAIRPDAILAAALALAFATESAAPFTIPVVCWDGAGDGHRPGEFSAMAWVVHDPADVPDGAGEVERLAALAARFTRQIEGDLARGGLAGLRHLAAHRARPGGAQARAFSLDVVCTGLADWGVLPAEIADDVRWRTATPDVLIDAVAMLINGELRLAWDVADSVDQAFAGRIFARTAQLVAASAAAPHKVGRPGAEDAASGAARFPHAWNDTARPFAATAPVHVRFEAAAAARPDRIALRWATGAWTFAELNGRANRIARALLERGFAPGDAAAIRTARGPDMVAAVFGVLKAGGFYVPIEPSQPAIRVAGMLRDAAVSIVLTSSATPALAPPPDCPVLAVDTLPPRQDDGADPVAARDVDALAYVIFTSGSTGAPKGVAVAHRALCNLLDWGLARYRFGPGDLGLFVTSLAFDLSVFDILGVLGCGGALYVADEAEQRDPALLVEVFRREAITFWNSAPITLAALKPYFGDLLGTPAARSLRLAFLSGDYTPLPLIPALQETFPNLRLTCLGGATEATVWSNYFDVDALDPSWRSVPYGRPIDNARYYILDDRGAPCPTGVTGQLHIAGVVLARGYQNQPALTAARFVADPFAADGSLMYRTGDLASTPDGATIVFEGREDTQVKIRGFRVDLQEIAHALLEHGDIRDAVILIRHDASGDAKVVAYLETDVAIDPQAVRAFAARRLPAYMVPNFSHAMRAFPATPNGKLDRARLPWPLPAAPSAPAVIEAAAPAGQADRPPRPAQDAASLVLTLQALFHRLVGHPADPDADIWAQGATSFTLMQMSGALRKQHGVRVQIADLVGNATLRAMAAQISAGAAPAPGAPGSNQQPPAVRAADDARAGLADPGAALLDAGAKARFLAAKLNRRADLASAERAVLEAPARPSAWHDWRGTQRRFQATQVSRRQIGGLLSLLLARGDAQRPRFLYPSAGDTYCVQVYLWVREGRVDGLAAGYHWLDQEAGALVRVDGASGFDRVDQVFYNRESFDHAAGALLLVGEERGIEPLYGARARSLLLLEAGYIGQLLMMGQAAAGLGLCPIGEFETGRVAAALRLADSQAVLHSFLLGPVEHAAVPRGADFMLPILPAAASAPLVHVVGQSGRYPGADSPEALWALLRDGRSVLRPAPRRRGLEGLASSLVGGFLDAIDAFDAPAFAIAPASASEMDPQTRLLLQVCADCLERAGHTAASLEAAGEQVGVFVGHLWQDYGHVGADLPADQPARIAASGSEIANRLSHVFGFTGPSVAVDTSCCSVLTALHLAVTAIRRGDCASAMVCGVNLLAHAYHGRVLLGLDLVARSAPRGAWDAEIGGWAVGEGGGALLLRRDDAHGSASDTVLASVPATHAAHLGGACAFGVPNEAPLRRALRSVVAAADLQPGDIDYIECAASGAIMSDATEWQAIAQAFPAGVAVGTLKPNIGHLEAASGMSQLAKALLQLEHRELAPTRVAAARSALLDGADGPRIVEQPTRLGGGPRRILVNAVGATGSIAQAVLAAPPERLAAPPAAGPGVLLLSAGSARQLAALAARFASALPGTAAGWGDICWTTQTGRTDRVWRLAVEAGDAMEASTILHRFARTGIAPGARHGAADPTLADRRAAAGGPSEAIALWCAGYKVEWHTFWTGTPRRVCLPTYPYETSPGWVDGPRPAAPAGHGDPSASAGHGDPSAPADHGDAAWIEAARAAYARAAGFRVGDLHPNVPLERYGLSSRIAAAVAAELSVALGDARLPATLLYEHRDLAAVGRAVGAVAGRPPSAPQRDAPPPAAGGPVTASRPAAHPAQPADRARQPIAVIGMGGRYPGAPTLAAFWRQLLAGEDMVAGPPAARAAGFGPVPPPGAFLDDVAGFDPVLFGITPDDAAQMDPQERLFLEVAWEALDHACWPAPRIGDELQGRAGVFVGAMHNHYPLVGADLAQPGRRVACGGTLGGISQRVSYHFDLRGPSIAIDTTCASALTALHLAVEALRRGEIDLAIVGGANLSLHQDKFVQQARLGMTSPRGRCRPFAADADGFVPGEGLGALVLRRLDDAEADGDRILGRVLGTAVNHGGKVNGYTVPSPDAQSAVIRAALDAAGVAAGTVSYLEAHGTGTALGDPIEARAACAVLAAVGRETPLAVGSVKSNIGHLEGAAGIAGITKVLLQMQHATIVASLHAATGNPDIDWTRMRVPAAPEPWPALPDGGRLVRRAGVSAFGAGGTNAHAILEDHPPSPAPGPAGAPAADGPAILVLSAATSEALTEVARRLLAYLRDNPATAELRAVAATLQRGRAPLRERWAAACRTLQDASAQLARLVQDGAGGHRGRARPGAPGPGADATPDQVAACWVAGGKVDWRARDAGGHGWADLPSYPFARLHCWARADRHGLAWPQDDARPLCKLAWRDRAPGAGDAASCPRVCLLVDGASAAAGRELARALAPRAASLVEVGTPERLLPRAAFDAIVVLPGIAGGPDGALAAFETVRALVRAGGGHGLHLLHLRADAEASGGAALLAALIHGLAQETPALAATTVAVAAALAGDMAALGARIGGELADGDAAEVRWSPHGRQVASWVPVAADAGCPWAPRPDRLYLVTGGTRGIGARLAQELVRRGAAHLLLTGRTPHAAAAATIRRLQAAGARVTTHFGPVEDGSALEHAISGAREAGMPLGGVFHCAGLLGEPGIDLIDAPLSEIASVAAPKLGGMRALLRIVADARPEVAIAFSSVAAARAEMAAGVGAYAAANRAMELLAEDAARGGAASPRTIAWPVWESSTASAAARASLARCGMAPLGDSEAFALLWRVIGAGEATRFAAVDTASLPDAPRRRPAPDPLQTPPEPTASPETAWLAALVARRIGLPLEALSHDAHFSDIGIESILLGRLVQDIEAAVGRPIDPTLLLDHPTVQTLAAALAARGLLPPAAAAVAPRSASPAPAGSAPAQSPGAASDLVARAGTAQGGGIAIVGMAVRFPGAADAAGLWDMLCRGGCAIGEVPAARWDVGELFDPDGRPGASISRWGGFLDGIEAFDPDWFRMSDAEATCLDPAIRLFLEGAETCLRDHGRTAAEIDTAATAIFVGARLGDYRLRVDHADGDAGLGLDQNFIAARVAKHLDLHGPCAVVDTACSSSLTAIHLACQSLLSGEANLAFAGGVDVLLDEQPYLQFTAARALSPTGRCRTFSIDADGFVPGEGCGVFLLKRTADAIAAGDRILAVIEGSATNNDGRTMGLTTPNPDAQQAVVRAALRRAGRRPEEVGMVEAHGTATLIGDPIELRALGEALGGPASPLRRCAVGSVKTNLGHLFSAAGAAGLAKAVLAIRHETIPASLFCATPNPRFNFAASPFFVPTEAQAWQAGPLVAGVSAFGLGGSNAHLIVAAAPPHGAGRASLPPPVFRRRHLWLDRPRGQPQAAPSPGSPEIRSLLELEFLHHDAGRLPAETFP